MRATILRFSTSAARRIARYLQCDRASTAIEFAFVGPIIIAILLATTQVAVIYIAQCDLETISEAGMRTVLTNQANGVTASQFHTEICQNITALFQCSNLIVDVEQVPANNNLTSVMPQFDANGNLKNPTNFVIAPAPAKMMLIVMYQWPVIGGMLGLNFGNLGNGAYLMVSTQVFQVEPS
jgi:Flp pilus assembly protein TadG